MLPALLALFALLCLLLWAAMVGGLVVAVVVVWLFAVIIGCRLL